MERVCSDEKKGWVCLSIKSPKSHTSVYVTKTGKVRLYNQKTGEEYFTKEKNNIMEKNKLTNNQLMAEILQHRDWHMMSRIEGDLVKSLEESGELTKVSPAGYTGSATHLIKGSEVENLNWIGINAINSAYTTSMRIEDRDWLKETDHFYGDTSELTAIVFINDEGLFETWYRIPNT